MIETNAHNMWSAASVASAALARGAGIERVGHRLSSAALAVAAEHVPPALSPIVLSGMIRAIEGTLVVLTGVLVHFAYVLPTEGFSVGYMAAIAIFALLSVIAFQTADLYEVQAFRRPVIQLARLVSTWSIVFLIAMAVLFFGKFGDSFSRVWLASFYGAGLVALLAERSILYALVRGWMRTGRLTRRTVIIGGGDAGEQLAIALRSQLDSDVRIIGMFDDRNDDRAPSDRGGLQKLGTVDDFLEFARRSRVDLAIFALPISAEGRILQMVKKLWVLPIDIRLSAHTNKLQFRPRSYSYIGSVPVIDMFDRPIADWDVVMKWVFDKTVGGLCLLAALPIMAAISVLIKLDSKGPVLFRQKRYGFNNDLIEVYKFRSMYAEATDASASKLVTKDDPRVTRIGRYLRKWSLDELPQLFNVVLIGNLSLVGPRPHAVNAKAEQRLYDEAVDGYYARHRVKPGVTGWAQINGWRGETDTQEKIQRRVEYDLFYIENWSVLFDLYIVAKTPFALLKTENAY